MEIIVYGVNFGHKVGEFCPREISKFYFFSYFRTDYLYELDGKMLAGRAGDMLICPPGQIIYHGPTENMTAGFANDWVRISGDEVGELLEKYRLPLNTPFDIGKKTILASAIEQIHKERSFKLTGSAEKCELVVKNAIIDLGRARESLSTGGAKGRLEYARGRIMGEFQRQWTLFDMASLCGYSQSRFCALYKQTFGISPINDLLATRAENARLLLLYGNMSVGEIAEAVGFSSIYYFSKFFKGHFGISPDAMRRKTTESQEK